MIDAGRGVRGGVIEVRIMLFFFGSGSNSAVECLPSKQGVAGSNPVSRSTGQLGDAGGSGSVLPLPPT